MVEFLFTRARVLNTIALIFESATIGMAQTLQASLLKRLDDEGDCFGGLLPLDNYPHI